MIQIVVGIVLIHFAHHLLYSCMGRNLYSYINVKKYLMFPVVFVPVWGVCVCLSCIFKSGYNQIREKK